MNIVKLISVALIITLPIRQGLSQEQLPAFSENDKKELIGKVTSLLNQYYVFPETAGRMNDHILQKLNKGSYRKLKNPRELASQLTQDLVDISKDKHLRIYLASDVIRTAEDEPLDRILYKFNREQQNTAIIKLEILEGNVGLIKINSLAYNEDVSDRIKHSLKLISKVNAVILDLTDNRGGNPNFATDLFGYFFDKPTHINSIYRRDRNKTMEYWTKPSISEVRLSDVPMFILISPKTFSGGEELAYDLQALKRAVIVGENSAGAAHITSSFDLFNNIRITIPVGRAINPVTGTNWEGTGVKPDISTRKGSAYTVTLQLAKNAAKEYYESQKSEIISGYNEMKDNLLRSERLINELKPDLVDSLIRASMDKIFNKNRLDEPAINAIGYDFLRKNSIDMAVMILRYNTTKFPDSWNVYDSLAEAYWAQGRIDLAVFNFKKSLELNPENSNARQMLERIGK